MIQLRPKAIENWRKGKGPEWTQAYLAAKAGVSRHTVMRLEGGGSSTQVTFETINRLAKALSVDAEVLVTFEK